MRDFNLAKLISLVLATAFGLFSADACRAAVPAAGGDLARIVVADAADPVQKATSGDLQRIFALVTGQKIDIATESGPGRSLYIGRGPDGLDLSSKLAGLDDQGIYLSVTPERIICTGKTPQGVYNAVAELLYQIGYRSIWPGQYGECLPDGPELKLGKNIEIVHNPSFQLRGGHTVHVVGDPGEKTHHVNVEQWVDWAARNHINRLKGGYVTTWDYGSGRAHGWQEVAGHTIQDVILPAREFGKECPEEWYALFNGKRVAKNPIGTNAEPCVSNQAFVDHTTDIVLKYFRENPTAHRYMIGAADEPSYWCECDNCKALDPVQYDWVHEGGTRQERYNLSDRWFHYVNEVADRVAVEFPGKWISTYAYASTRDVPIKTPIAKNVMVEVTIPLLCRKHKLFDPTCPDNVIESNRIRAWMKVAPAISIYSYLEFADWGIPISFFDSEVDLYRSLHELGVNYISDELDTTMYASPLYMGLWGRLLWDVDTDENQYITDFCRIAYGPAAKDMEKFWRNQQEVMQNSKVKHRGYLDIVRFTPEIIAASQKMLDEAMTRSLSKDQIARVQSARMALLMAEYYVSRDVATSGKDKSVWIKVRDSREQVYKIAKDYGFSITLYAWNALGGGEQMFAPVPAEINDNVYRLPTEALGGKLLLALPDQWMFRTDPRNQGVKEKWFADGANLKGYKLISTSAAWENQWVGPYDGYAWYMTDVTIPKAEGKRVWILFGAVDETWKVWLAGNYIGASKGEPVEIWDKPCAIEITHQYPPGVKIRLAVQVHDSAYLGGIWKPVTIVTSDK